MEFHKVQEWEDKKPYNADFKEMKLESGRVMRAIGAENLNGKGNLEHMNKALMWEADGKAYELYERQNEYSSKLRNIMENELKDSLADHPETFFVRNSIYDIHW